MLTKKFLVLTKIVGFFVIVFIAISVILSIIPAFGKYQTLVVTSTSMSPTIKQGGLIFVKKSQNYQKNDIITFKLRTDPRSLMTHRIVSIQKIKNQNWYQVKGDAVKKPDIELVNQSQIIGKLVFIIPYLGIPISFAKTQLGVVVIIVIPASIIVYEEFKTIFNELKKMKKTVVKLEKKEDKLEEVIQKINKNK